MSSQSKLLQPRVLISDAGTANFQLPESGEITIGRSGDNDVVLADPTVSRRHATLFIGAGEVAIADAGSKAGTFANGARVHKRTPVRAGDLLEFGQARLLAAAPTPTTEEGADGWRDGTAMFDVPPAIAPAKGDALTKSPVPPVEAGVVVVSGAEPVGRPIAQRKSGHALLGGIVRSPSVRSEPFGQGAALQILTFSLLVFDRRGARTDAISVDMRGLGLKGPTPIDGQHAQVSGTFNRHGVLNADWLRLMDTGAVVRATGRSAMKMAKVVTAVLFALVLAIFGWVGVSVLDHPFGETVEAPQVQVPEVRRGEKLIVVDDRLRDAGLQTDRIHQDVPDLAFNSVIKVDPRPGSHVAKGSTVKIYVSVHQ